MERIREQLTQVSWLSLDVFDTALLRKLHQPTDIFHMMQDKVANILGSTDVNFASVRIAAERDTRTAFRRVNKREEITLTDIYDTLGASLKLFDKQKSKLLDLEFKTELRFIYVNPPILDLYQEALRIGKSVIFLSDMYLSSSQIATLLITAGYENPVVYVSSELGCNKGSGKLYQKMLTRLNIEGRQILHVGDNYRADYLRARLNRWRAVHFSSLPDRLPKRDVEPHGDTFSALCRGVTKHYQISHANISKTDRDVWRSLGYTVVGPIFLSFLVWLYQETSKSGIKRIHFCARDGYSLVKGLELLKQICHWDIECNYVYASRKIFGQANVRALDSSSLSFLLMVTPGLTLRDFVVRCGCDPLEHEAALRALGFSSLDMPLTEKAFGRFIDSSYGDLLERWVKDNEQQLLGNYGQGRTLVLKYLKGLGIHQKDAAVVDIGWNGTLIQAMQNILQDDDKTCALRSYFFATRPDAETIEKTGGSVRSFLFHFGQPRLRAALVCECIELVELLFSAPHPTIVGLKETSGEISPVYGIREYTADQLGHLDVMREAALEFIEHAASLCPSIHTLPPSADYVAQCLDRLLKAPTPIEAKALGSIGHWHGYGDQGILRKLAMVPTEQGKPSDLLTLGQAYGECLWKKGFSVQISPFSFKAVQLIHFIRAVYVAYKSGTFWVSVRWVLFKTK